MRVSTVKYIQTLVQKNFFRTPGTDRDMSLKIKGAKVYCSYWHFFPELHTAQRKTRRSKTCRDQKISFNYDKAETEERGSQLSPSGLSLTDLRHWTNSSSLAQPRMPNPLVLLPPLGFYLGPQDG